MRRIIRDGVSAFHGQVSQSWRHPEGWQAVVRTSGEGTLAVIHTFGGEIPDQVWLVTSESGSVRDWAEQLAVSAEKRSLHVLGSGQLEPLLGSYLLSGLVKSAMSRDQDLIHLEENAAPGRTQIAVLYLAALLPLAWLSGIASGFLKSDPNYVRKKNRKPEEIQADTEKEDANDRRL